MKEHEEPSAESIIKTYRALVAERGGAPVGERVFTRETGIPRYNWMGGHWRSWSSFQEAAGYSPNDPTQKIPDDILLRRFAELALERGEVPTAVAEYCEGNPDFAPVFELIGNGTSGALDRRLASLHIGGFVYLLRSGKSYKIGRTNAVGRGVRELAIQLPQRPDMVHVIETDDPEGIERYWYNRFADRRQGGEWFALTADDVRAFNNVASSSGLSNTHLEPTRLLSCAIMSPRRAARATSW